MNKITKTIQGKFLMVQEMKAIVLRKHSNDPRSLKIEEVETPIPGKNEVRIKIKAIGVNYAESMSRRGIYKWAPRLPYILGLEAAGVIDMVGDGVEEDLIGKPVIVGRQHGTYAEYIVVKKDEFLPAVPGYNMNENAAFVATWLTAWIALKEIIRIRPGETILVNAAAGGVGTAAVKIAIASGCKVIGGTSSPKKMKVIEELGAIPVNYKERSLKDEVMKITGGKGVHGCLESIGGKIFRESLESMAPLGRMAIIGASSIRINKYNPLSWYRAKKALPKVKLGWMMHHGGSVGAFHLGRLLAHPDLVRKHFNDLVDFVVKHDLKPVIGHVLDLEEAWKAHELMEQRKNIGKIILIP